MSRLIKPAIIFALGFLVFIFFYGIIGLPLSIEKLDELKPILYGYVGDFPQNVYVAVYTKAGYTVYAYWAYWPDTRKAEYEPFAVVYNPDGKIYAFITRIHWEWRVKYTEIIQENNRAIVYFRAEVHTPYNGYPPSETVKIDYTPQLITTEPEPVDWWSIAGLSQKPSEALKNAILYSTITMAGSAALLYSDKIKRLIK
jgi:hypothetical protein